MKPAPYDNIYILGGHKLALTYYDKLNSAKKEGHLNAKNIFCVTPDPKASAFDEMPKENIIFQKTSELIADQCHGNSLRNDIIVPDHTAKHVFLETLMQRIKVKAPHFTTKLKPFQNSFNPPFLKKGDDSAIWAMSYATWSCPADCNEPQVCPHLDAPRTWDFDKSFEELFSTFSQKQYSIHCFRCEPLFEEIAHIPFSKISEEMKKMDNQLERGKPFNVIVVTYSHCHAILGQFEVINPYKAST